jgi:hypothetical protein
MRKIFGMLVLGSIVLIILIANPVGAQTFSGFGQGYQIDPADSQGLNLNPSVAIYNAIIVEVDERPNPGPLASGSLFYRVGRIAGPPAAEQNSLGGVGGGVFTPPPITWSDSKQFDDNGLNPSVALVGSTVIEVHNGGPVLPYSGPLYYRTGTLNGDFINWSEKNSTIPGGSRRLR